MKSTDHSPKTVTRNAFLEFFVLLAALGKARFQICVLTFKNMVIRREQRLLLLRLGYPLPKDGNYYWPGEEVANPSENVHSADSSKTTK